MSLHIFFTTDIHGNYFSHDFRTRQEGDGSLERVYAFVEEARERYGRENVALIDGGDIIQGGPEAYFLNHIAKTGRTHGIGEMCRFAGYDAGAVGNHDIESGQKATARFQRASGYPMLAANIKNRQGRHPFVPYTVLSRGGMKIAVTGFTTPATKRWLPEEVCGCYEFEDILPSARRWAKAVRRREQPDLMVAVLHSGWTGGLHNCLWDENEAKRLAEAVEGYDLVLFGHDHFSRVENVRGQEGKDILCLNAGCYGYEIGEVVVDKNADGTFSMEGRLHDIRQFHNHHAERFAARFKPLSDSIGDYTSTTLGILTTPLDISKAFWGPSAYMALIHSLQLHVSGADISLCSPYYMESVIEPGPLTIAQLYTIYWFEDRLYTIRMTGHEIKGLLERSYWLWTNTVTHPGEPLLKTYTDAATGKTYFKHLFFNFDTAAGIDYEVDVTKPFGQKINILRMSDGKPFMPDKEYTVATIGNRANGGGGMLTLGAGIPDEELPRRVVGYTPHDIRHYLRQYIEDKGFVSVEPLQNWRFIGTNTSDNSDL